MSERALERVNDGHVRLIVNHRSARCGRTDGVPERDRFANANARRRSRNARPKRERRDLRRAGDGEDTAETPPPRSQDEVLAELAALHDEHESGRLSFDDFEVAKADLLAQLQV